MPPPTHRSFVKKTKAGRVQKVVREHYLRDDIYVGSECASDEFRGPDSAHWKLSKDAEQYIVIDTNVALHQIDLLAHSSVTDVIVTSVVLEECKARSRPSYERLRQMCQDPLKRFFVFANEHHRDTFIKAEAGESPNDRNDRAIRVVCKFYERAVPSIKIVLLSNDRGNLKKAKDEGLSAMSVREFATHFAAKEPELDDLVAPSALDNEDEVFGTEKGDAHVSHANKRHKVTGTDGKDNKNANAKFTSFSEHLSQAAVAAGVAGGSLHQGGLRTSRHSPWEGTISCDAIDSEILIIGRDAMNRAMDGDTVAVKLLPESEWKKPSSVLPSSGGDGDGDVVNDTMDVSLAPRIADDEDIPVESALNDSKGSKGTPTGVVVGIVKRNWRERGYASSLDIGDGGGGAAGRRAVEESNGARPARVLVIPVDRRLPKIRIQTRHAKEISDQRLVVVIDDWPNDSMYPTGHYVKSLGLIGDADAETAAVLLEADVDDRPFAPAVHACVPPLPWAFDAIEHLVKQPHREDHRDLRVCSVDPPGCRDIDDALSCRVIEWMDDGMGKQSPKFFELGIHIADVTSFLRPETAMDSEAKRRGTTTYLVNKRLDMLPKPLTEDICSLRGGTERLTFSVFFKFSAETFLPVPGSTHRFTKAAIRSNAALTYQEAQEMMDDPTDVSDLASDLRNINACAKALRKRRIESGALSLASPEVKFEMDQSTQDPLDVGMYVTREANRMVEEMMLLANVASAETILKKFPSQAMLRKHPAPLPRMFGPLLKSCEASGIEMDVTSSKTLADSLDNAVRADDPYFNTLLRIVATRCMSQAQYCVSESGGSSGGNSDPSQSLSHYGLAAPLYTHFTSPIRRYADVVVHRLLNAALGLEPLDAAFESQDGLRATADNVNLRHRNSQSAGRASVELHTHIFFKKKPIERCEARVVRVKANGVVVFVPKFGIEAPLVFEESGDKTEGEKTTMASKCVFDEDAMRVTDPSGKTWQIFDALLVRIEIEELPARRSRLAIRAVE